MHVGVVQEGGEVHVGLGEAGGQFGLLGEGCVGVSGACSGPGVT